MALATRGAIDPSLSFPTEIKSSLIYSVRAWADTKHRSRCLTVSKEPCFRNDATLRSWNKLYTCAYKAYTRSREIREMDFKFTNQVSYSFKSKLHVLMYISGNYHMKKEIKFQRYPHSTIQKKFYQLEFYLSWCNHALALKEPMKGVRGCRRSFPNKLKRKNK